jgi:hypothetical protein
MNLVFNYETIWAGTRREQISAHGENSERDLPDWKGKKMKKSLFN